MNQIKFYSQLNEYRSKYKGEMMVSYMLNDDNQQELDAHYFYMGVWAFNKIKKNTKKVHIDVGGELNWAGIVSTLCPVEYVDIRPLHFGQLKGMTFITGDIKSMPYKSNSVESLSCLHVLEHIGLGRYGDEIDIDGTRKACAELARILKPGGNLYVAFPVGIERVIFNAHRIIEPREALSYFDGLKLKQLCASHIDNDGQYRENVKIEDLVGSPYACAMFHFTK